MKRLKTKKTRAARPTLKSINLTPAALAIWDREGRKHNWSKEISWYITGLYSGRGVTTEQRVTILRRLRAGILTEISDHKRRVGGLNASLSTLNDEIDSLRRQKE